MHESTPAPTPLGHYRQILTTPAHRRFITVARQPIVDDTLEVLRTSATKKSKHHFLFIGPRGIGKSHLLSLIEDGIADDPELKKSYLVARFPEESHRTLSFADFLLGLCDILREAAPEETEWEDLYQALQTEEEDTRIIDTLVPAIRRANEAHQRTTLVMLENLNELFTRQIKNKKDIGALRKFFMDPNGCLLISTSPIHFDAITSVDEPFYDFFDTQILDHLSEEDTIALIHRNLEWEKRQDLIDDFASLRPKLIALYRMTAGSPRLTVMLYELIAHDSITKVRQQLEILLDRITPFYQDRLNELAPQERALLETMARMRDMRKTPMEIASRMRLPQNQTSNLLKRLTDAQYLRVHTNPDDKRSRLYTIREGFFDIWLAMNVSRSARKRLPFLLDFFALFYPSIEARNRKRAELTARSEADALASLDYLSDVGSVEERRRSKLELAGRVNTLGKKEEATEYLQECLLLDGDPRHADYLGEIEEMIHCWDLHRDGQLEAFGEKLHELSNSLSYKTWSETKIAFLMDELEHVEAPNGRAKLRNRLAMLLLDLARFAEAEELLRKALREVPSNSFSLHSGILNNLAQLLYETNRLKEAEPMMRDALRIAKDTFGDDHPEVAIYLNNLAQILHDTNRLHEAELMMRDALRIDHATFGDDHPKVATDLNNIAQILHDTTRLDEAELMMREGLRIDRAAFGDDHPNIATQLSNLAQLLEATRRFNEAEPMMRDALRIDRFAFGDDHPRIAIRLNNLALLLEVTNRLDEAEPMMRDALRIDRSAFGNNHPTVAVRLGNLSALLAENKRFEEAEPLMKEAVNILANYQRQNGYSHRENETIAGSYQSLLETMDLPPEEIESRMEEALSGIGHPEQAAQPSP
ncbi:MAG: tetratricopeptide repeat protein [Luteolibacter sp.]